MRKTTMLRTILGVTILALAALLAQPGSIRLVKAQTDTPPPSSSSFARPLVTVSGYYLDKDTIQVGDNFKLFVTLQNEGQENARNLILSFGTDSFYPQESGGVQVLGELAEGQSRTITQRFLVGSGLWGIPTGTIPVSLTYTDEAGTAYSETFTITLQLHVYYGEAKPTPTPTQAEVYRPQLVVSHYQTDTDPLQSGTQFTLDLDIDNLGNADARAVTMVLGGGVDPSPEGTPVVGGVGGGSGDLSNIAPLGSSNLVYLGDIVAGDSLDTSIQLIVNVSANPGVYTFKVSFVYTDPKGNRLVDDQVITLLVYRLPSLEVNFYRAPDLFMAGQPANLPLQVVNLGRNSAVLGNMTVTAEGVEIQNNTVLVGNLDPGGYFSLDAMAFPMVGGPLELKVVINYTDDFNANRQIEKTLTVNVEEALVYEEPPPGEGGMDFNPVPAEETFWQKALRFLKGLVGLDSAPPETTPGGVIEMPAEGIPPSELEPMPAPEIQVEPVG